MTFLVLFCFVLFYLSGYWSENRRTGKESSTDGMPRRFWNASAHQPGEHDVEIAAAASGYGVGETGPRSAAQGVHRHQRRRAPGNALIRPRVKGVIFRCPCQHHKWATIIVAVSWLNPIKCLGVKKEARGPCAMINLNDAADALIYL